MEHHTLNFTLLPVKGTTCKVSEGSLKNIGDAISPDKVPTTLTILSAASYDILGCSYSDH